MNVRFSRGAAAPLMLLLITGALTLAVFTLDSTRVKSDAAQLKRATDAAALAVSQAAVRDPKTDVQQLAERYIKVNLGMDDTQLSNELRITLSKVETDEGKGYKVTATFRSSPLLAGSSADNVSVASTAVARYSPLEVSLVLPNTVSEQDADIAALKRLGKRFAERLLANTGSDDTMWLALVPYSQSVNVYDDSDTGRLRRWARSGALNPVELTSLFRSGKASSLADQRIPDRRAKLLCVYRGLGAGENFFWDQQPVTQFKIYYRHDLPENGSPGATPISWVGPNPDFGQANGVLDTRWMVADRGCPNTPLLPLSNDLDTIETRLDMMTTRFNVNYAIAMSWAAASLSPAMRGTSGWGNSTLPLDFNEDDSQPNQKAIIMLANTTGDWFDTDAYNAEVAQALGTAQTGSDGARVFATQRFVDLCRSFQARNLRFHFIGVRPGDPKDFGRTLFDQVAGPGLSICASKNGSMNFINGSGFATAEDQIASQLDDLADELRRDASFARLVQ